MQNKKIMILGASILQLPAIEAAVEMGLSVVAVDMNPDAIGFKVPGIETEVISTIDIPKVVEAAKKHQIDGVMTLASDMPMRTVAAVAKEMGLVGITEDTAIKATNKAEMRKALEAANVPVPKFFRVTNEEEFRQAAGQMTGQRFSKAHHLAGNTCVVHNRACHDEEGNCQQREVLCAGNKALQQQVGGRTYVDEAKVGQRCTEQCISDGNTGEVQDKYKNYR